MNGNELRRRCAVGAIGAATRRIAIDFCFGIAWLREGKRAGMAAIRRRVLVPEHYECGLVSEIGLRVDQLTRNHPFVPEYEICADAAVRIKPKMATITRSHPCHDGRLQT